jgi:hypothetical protein
MCVEGIPKLYVEDRLSSHDRELRDRFYGGLLGRYYQFVMPFLALPVRPLRLSWKGWAFYFAAASLLIYIVLDSIKLLVAHDFRSFSVFEGLVILGSLWAAYFFSRHRYLLALLFLAVPVRLSLLFTRFESAERLDKIHQRLIAELAARGKKLQILDISTGTCNSLLRHGWTELDAAFTALDLSETMLLQGRKFTSARKVPVEFVLGDAAQLPFVSQTFDVVLNYGAINGMTDPNRALEEMARVAKPEGLVLFLDEQLYASASFVEKVYFRFVLSSHNVIHSCPIEAIPPELERVDVRQVYAFYYLCTAYKQ